MRTIDILSSFSISHFSLRYLSISLSRRSIFTYINPVDMHKEQSLLFFISFSFGHDEIFENKNVQKKSDELFFSLGIEQ